MTALPWRTNGGLTTRAASSLPRMSTWTALARAGRDARQRDRALERRRERAAGDLALAHAGDVHLLVPAQHAAVLEHQADQLARHAALLLRGSAPRPMKSRSAVQASVQPRPDSSGVASRPCRCRRGSCRPRGAACRGRRARRARRRRVERVPERARLRGWQHDLEAVLAGVAGARDEQLAGRPAEERAERERRARGGPGTSSRCAATRLRALHRDHREVVARLDAHVEARRPAARSRQGPCRAVPAFTTRRYHGRRGNTRSGRR